MLNAYKSKALKESSLEFSNSNFKLWDTEKSYIVEDLNNVFRENLLISSWLQTKRIRKTIDIFDPNLKYQPDSFSVLSWSIFKFSSLNWCSGKGFWSK